MSEPIESVKSTLREIFEKHKDIFAIRVGSDLVGYIKSVDKNYILLSTNYWDRLLPLSTKLTLDNGKLIGDNGTEWELFILAKVEM